MDFTLQGLSIWGTVWFRGLQCYQDFSFISLRNSELWLLLWLYPQAGFLPKLCMAVSGLTSAPYILQRQKGFLSKSPKTNSSCTSLAHISIPQLNIMTKDTWLTPKHKWVASFFKARGYPSRNKGVLNREHEKVHSAGATSRCLPLVV